MLVGLVALVAVYSSLPDIVTNKEQGERMNDYYETISHSKAIKFLGGRPVRNTCIGLDDIVNLKIALNTSTSFEEFFALT
jgi:hypothetical protein